MPYGLSYHHNVCYMDDLDAFSRPNSGMDYQFQAFQMILSFMQPV